MGQHNNDQSGFATLHRLLTNQRSELPKSIANPEDAVIVAHWVIETLRTLCTGDDVPSFTAIKTDKGEIIELFISNYQLREYCGKELETRTARFEIHLDLRGEAVWSGYHLKEALIALLLIDLEAALRHSWTKFFSQKESV